MIILCATRESAKDPHKRPEWKVHERLEWEIWMRDINEKSAWKNKWKTFWKNTEKSPVKEGGPDS